MRRIWFLTLLMVYAGVASAQQGIVSLPHTGRPACCTGRHGFPHGQFVFPFYPFWYEDESTTSHSNISATAPTPAPPSIPTPPSPSPPPARAQLIEVPEPKAPTAANPQRSTIFILKDGTRIYARRYVLTTQALRVSIDQQERQFPFSALDVNATLAANREQGSALRIPAEPGEVALGF